MKFPYQRLIFPEQIRQSLSLARGSLSCTCSQLTFIRCSASLKSESESCSVMSNSLRPHYTVHGILQPRILEWIPFPFSRGSSQPGIEPRSPALQVDSLPAEAQGKPSASLEVSKLKASLRQMTTHSSVLAWKISWTEEPGGLQSMGSQESDIRE